MTPLPGLAATATAPATGAPARVIADVASEQRRTWAAAVLGQRQALWLDGSADPLGSLRHALDADAVPEAIAWVDGLERATSLEDAGRVLQEASARGSAVVVAVPNTRLRASFDAAGGLILGWDEARRLADLLDGEVIEQQLAEAALIGARADRALTGTVLGADAPEPDDACAWLIHAGVDPADADARLLLTARPVHRAYLAALEAANAELRRANARLARAHLGRHDAGAASVLGRLQKEREDERERAIAEIARLEERLELEKQVAMQNDRYFQDARATLQLPEYRAAAVLAARFRGLPGGRYLLRLVRLILSR